MRDAVLVSLLLTACAAPGGAPDRYNQAQLNAIETRDVVADYDRTFSAAASALLDAGYTIAFADKTGGLLTGQRTVDRTVQRILVSSLIRDSHYVITIKLRRQSARLTAARIKLSFNGEARVHKETIDQVWVLMQRQVLMNDPPDVDLTPGRKKAHGAG